ncbi:hypothetical protein [Kaarinaea lacus]
MAFRLKILLIFTGLLVGGLLLFSSGSDIPERVKDNSELVIKPTLVPPKKIATPFADPLNDVEDQPLPIQDSNQQNTVEVNIPAKEVNAIQKTPQQIIDAYMSAWSANNRSEVNVLWREIALCPACLQRIQELLMNQGVPKGMLLELTYQIIELGDESMLPLFDYLLQPSVDLNTRIIITQQMIKDGRDMYVRKLFDILQQADIDGYQEFAVKHTWMISKLRNPQGIAALFDVVSGRSGASERFVSHVRNVFHNTLLGTKQSPDMTDAMADYFFSANEIEQDNLWSVVSSHSESLVALATKAYDIGNINQFKKYSQTLAGINSVSAIEGILELAAQVDYSQEYFATMISTSAQRYNNMEVLRKLEDYLRNPNTSMRTRIVAAEGLLAVKDLEYARYILDKTLNSSRYEDSEIVTYISARL